jgi:hypothetical protein
MKRRRFGHLDVDDQKILKSTIIFVMHEVILMPVPAPHTEYRLVALGVRKKNIHQLRNITVIFF